MMHRTDMSMRSRAKSGTKPIVTLMLFLFSSGFLPERDATTMIRISPVALEFQILLENGELTTEAMVRESEAILDRHRDTAFLRIQFAESRATLNICSFLPDGIANRGIWALAKRRWNGTNLRYGELISLNGNAVLRIRDGFAIRTQVIRRRNPLALSVAGRAVEFVHFGLIYNHAKNRVLWIDASAAVPNGALDAKLAQVVVQSAQRALAIPLPANVTIGEDRFYFFTPRFADSLLFDLDPPAEEGEWAKVRRAECAVNREGHGYCFADGTGPGRRQSVKF